MTRALRDVLHISGAKGVDIDDVTIMTKDKKVSYVNKVWGDKLIKPFKEQDLVWVELENLKTLQDIGINHEDVVTMLKYMETHGIIENIMPRLYCIPSLKALSESGPVYFDTSRGNGYYCDAEGMTDRWLAKLKEKYNFSPTGVIYNHNKDETTNTHDIRLLLDDNPVFALSVIEKGVPVILFNAPWNMSTSNDKYVLSGEVLNKKKMLIEKIESYSNELIFRVDDWRDIYKNL